MSNNQTSPKDKEGSSKNHRTYTGLYIDKIDRKGQKMEYQQMLIENIKTS